MCDARVFDLAGQSGTITAQRIILDAEAFFRPPEQRMDLGTGQWLAQPVS
ncbi:hypothetical protein [Luteimonas kalidii]|uniref:Uncharacterized protein n=1 Tax=Luteimonas kalidii TaxID=3042025 RepID=A0ABT6JQ77_9GAMM|nr:hypothetical protein [Luteimonas kalidii]MDH5832841.1 hypothetical protein [Luteimonas kalidii]